MKSSPVFTGLQTVEKALKGFSAEAYPPCSPWLRRVLAPLWANCANIVFAHGLSALPPNCTVARIEVFFGSAKPNQKMDFKARFAGKSIVFRQAAARSLPGCFFSEIIKIYLKYCEKSDIMNTWNSVRFSCYVFPWGCSSVGRALASHVRGQGFESPHLHQRFAAGTTAAKHPIFLASPGVGLAFLLY